MINLENGKIEIDITKFLTDVKNIQALPDKPAETADKLKQLFDKAGEDIKKYINDELIVEIKEAFAKTFEVIENKSGEIETSKENINEIEKNINELEKATTISKYKIERFNYNENLEYFFGDVIDLPFYYKTNTNALDVYLNGEYLYKCKAHDTLEGISIYSGDGSYYEINENGEKILSEVVISNKIQITEDWRIEDGDRLEIIVRGEVFKEKS